MATTLLLSLVNPVSTERDAEFNDWFNTVHGAEVTRLPGFASLTRYRATHGVVPPGAEPTYRYLAVYELDDADEALRSLAEASQSLTMSDSADLAAATGIAFEQIYTTKDF